MAYYAEITNVDVPSEAAQGQTVNIAVTVTNNAQYNSIYDAVTANVDGTDLYFGDYKEVPPLGVVTFNDSFVMPGSSVTLNIYSWYWDGDKWVNDDSRTVDIALTEAEYDFTIGTPEVKVA